MERFGKSLVVYGYDDLGTGYSIASAKPKVDR